MDSIFKSIPAIRYEGPNTSNPLAFRYYDKDRMVLGKRMEDQLRCAVCYWHTFAWHGSDVFGAGTFERPWHAVANPIEAAELKLKTAFEFFEKLGAPFFTFHDRDIAPEGTTLKETHTILDRIVEQAEKEMQRTGVKLLWGTANLFSNPRYMAARPPTPIRRCSPTPRRRCARSWTSPTASAARTTCSGAAARATRPCSTPT